ncbi:prepilin peptidase [Ferroacidibacillus organovorans]|uniref:Prepilin peptidase n=1 Tax=Ferroacidibacillus organovorans TaxID=1765683 RepID=A0A1V4EU15_9BACL|nr:A24 family peptidase [Ferroacidibacillus organovorans]OPG16409.1 hypothetical protein B2M26_05905 [Ferroacidibacillus organovorans]
MVFVDSPLFAVFLSIYVFVAGAFFGSFLNVVGMRIPRGESIIFPGSHCDLCKRPLMFYELIPILSYGFLRGTCRTCGGRVSAKHVVFETLAGVLALYTLWHEPTWTLRSEWWLFWGLLLVTSSTDLEAMIVPNVISYPSAALFLLICVVLHPRSISDALLGMAVGFLLITGIHLLSKGKMGLGDAKLYLSIGIVLGPYGTLFSLIAASMLGTLIGYSLRFSGRLKPRQAIPFVPFIAGGVFLTSLVGSPVIDWYLHLLHVSPQ